MARRKPVARLVSQGAADLFAAESCGKSRDDIPEHTTPASIEQAAHLIASAAAVAGEGAAPDAYAASLADAFAEALTAPRAEQVAVELDAGGAVCALRFRVRGTDSTSARVLARSLAGTPTPLGVVAAYEATAANPWVAAVVLHFAPATETAPESPTEPVLDPGRILT